jgi:hypothetical protein
VAQHAQLTKRPWAAFTALLGFGMLAVYVAVIVAEGNNSIAEIAPWALLMAIPTILAFASVLMRDFRYFTHNAPFAAVRWTNLYFPVRFGFFGDVVGGPLVDVFGPVGQ